ncbi:MAG: AAA family ATPase [Clostridia bacterium]
MKKISLDDLKSNVSLKLDFKSTKEIEPYYGIIGQKKALDSIYSAMQIKDKGFNLYVSGSIGIGKTSYVLSVVNSLAINEKVPNDYIYLYNFENPNEPVYISLEAGMGYELKADMNNFITNLISSFKSKLTGDNYEKEKKEIIERHDKQKKDLISEFDKYSYSKGFKVKYSQDGISFSPVYKDKIIDEKEYSTLSEEVKEEFKNMSPIIQEETSNILKKLDNIDFICLNSIKEWETNLATFLTVQCIKDLKIKYKKNLKLQNFFYSIQSDTVKNLNNIKAYIIDKEKNKFLSPFNNYKVNLLVDNNNLDHAPVIKCLNPTYYDLFGKLEFETINNSIKTGFDMLKSGLIHRANGGYIILNIKDVLSSTPIWEALKRVIKSNEISIDSSRDINQPVTLTSLKPEAIPINIQFILIGSESNYANLIKLDPDFKKLFKMKAEFDDTTELTDDNLVKFVRYISFVCKQHNLLNLNYEAVIAVIEYSLKLSTTIDRLSANMLDICDILIESNFVASKAKIITEKHVKQAIINKKNRYSLYDDNLTKLILEDTVMISNEGSKIGQINGLTIINTGDFSFGKPVRITANTFLGKNGIVNIEREIAMSGSTHSKGVYILSAYIGEKYAQTFPLSLTASICFEQLYNGVDGDSASSTELYAILSSLSGIPIKQNFAVTGSVNQKGEIQPIGGVSEKIEGYYKVCKQKGLNNNSVLIPIQNIKNLILNDEVIESIEKNEFNIYAISNIDEGIELLTGIKSGKLINNEYEKDSINYLVYEKLKNYAINSKEYN